MLSIEKIKDFINQPNYVAVLNELIDHGFIIDQEMNSLGDETIFYFIEVLKKDLKRLQLSKLSLSHLSSILDEEPAKFILYTITKYNRLASISSVASSKDTSGEKQGELEIKQAHPFFPNFLLIYLIEFFFLRSGSTLIFKEYLKSNQMMNHEKYIVRLEAIYNEISLES